MKVGDEVECILDCHWRGIKDFCKVGDRGRLIKQYTVGNKELFDMEITYGWRAGEIAPIAVSNFDVYFKVIEESKAKYRVGMTLISDDDHEAWHGIKMKSGDKCTIKATVDDMFALVHEKTRMAFNARIADLDRYFNAAQVNPCPSCLQKWLADVQAQRP